MILRQAGSLSMTVQLSKKSPLIFNHIANPFKPYVAIKCDTWNFGVMRKRALSGLFYFYPFAGENL